MIPLLLSPPAILIPCQGGPSCPCGGRPLAFPLSGGLPFAPEPQRVWWAPTGWKRGRLGMVPLVGEA